MIILLIFGLVPIFLEIIFQIFELLLEIPLTNEEETCGLKNGSSLSTKHKQANTVLNEHVQDHYTKPMRVSESEKL